MTPFDFLLAIMVPMIWGFGLTVAKAAYVYVDFPPILLMAFRFALTAAVMVWFVRPPWGLMKPIFWISLVSATIQYSLTFTGLHGLDASTAVIVIQLEAPSLALFAAIVLKEKLGLRRTLGMAMAFLGVVFIAGQPRLQGSLVPVLMVASGAMTWAAGQIMVKKLDGKVPGFTLIAWVAVFATPQLFLSSWLFEDGQVPAMVGAGWIGWGAVVYLGLIMTGLGYTIWYHLIGKYKINQVMPFLLLLPVTSVAGSMLVLGERPGFWEFIGSAVVIIGVAVIITAHNDEKKPSP
ncbi:MAG: EamA family transporter [Rhodospirillaceae bacterium]|nr:EamA family transporter [Rhodospirillaceae bacterium]